MNEQELLEKEYDDYIDIQKVDDLIERINDGIGALMKQAYYSGWKKGRECKLGEETDGNPRPPLFFS